MAASTAGQFLHGTPDFKVIDIAPHAVAQALQAYVDRGSTLTGVSLDDISTAVHTIPANQAQITLVQLLDSGMKLFDAVVWLTAGKPASHPLQQDVALKKESCPSLNEVAQCVFYVYFFLLTQARYPYAGDGADAPKVPNFLKVVMGMDKAQKYYIDTLCSFNATKFDARWAQHVSFDGLGQEALSRFGLGVAGYRMFGPFKLFPVRADLDPGLANAVAFAKTVATSAPTWAVHPLTRSPAVLGKRGNLNKNLGNLILQAFTAEQIDLMVSSKVLYAKPVVQPAYTNYLTWAANDDISGNAPIFP